MVDQQVSYEELKVRYDTAQALVSYLLYEREEETQLRAAFACLVQQRHSDFHADGDKESDFSDCANEVCINALKILQESRQKRIELNEVSLQMIQDYGLHVRKTGRVCIAWLESNADAAARKSSLVLDV